MSRPTGYRRRASEGKTRRMTDTELRAYQFTHSAPETIEGFTKSKPDASVVPRRVLFKYVIPHTTGSRVGMIWCCYCQERNHFDGGVAEHTDGARRTVGRCCRSKHCSQLAALLEEFEDHYVRRLQLDQFDKIARVIPEVLDDAVMRLASGEAEAFQQHRSRLGDLCPGLFNYLYRAVVDDSGVLKWDVASTDYSRTVMTRERPAERDGGDVDVKEGLRGKRVVRLHRKYRIEGGELFNLHFSPLGALTKAKETLQEAAEFYGQRATDSIDGEEFNNWVRLLRNTVDLLERVQRALFAVPAFYEAENRKAIVTIRNNQMQEAAYGLTDTGITWNPSDNDSVVIEPPQDYSPSKFRTLGRLRRAMR